MSHQTFFVWPHGGKAVSLAGTFNHWNPHPLHKQGNYFFGVLDLPDGVYQYKFVVDGRWVYDISQIHADDGSGNWNNEIEVGKAVVHKEPSSQPIPKQQQQQQHQHQHKEQPQQKGEQQQQPKGEQPKGEQQQQQKSKKQLRKEQQQQQQAERQQKGDQPQQKGKQQQQQKGKKNEPPPEPVPEPEPQPAEQPAAQPEPEPEAQPAAQLEEGEQVAVPEAEAEAEAGEEQPAAEEGEQVVEAEVEAEAEAQADETPQVEQKPEKVLISILTIEVVGQSEVDMEAVEKFVRSVQRPGLKWEGSAVKPHVFGLFKLEIICQARDDVAIEGDVLNELERNEDLVASAQIIGFAC